jgi:hypothetical protein
MATKKAFKPCEGCPTPAKCKAAGKCLAKEGKAGKGGKDALVIMVGVGKPMKAKKKCSALLTFLSSPAKLKLRQ